MKPFLAICLLALTASAQVPSRLCIKDPRLSLEVDTVALTYKAETDGQTFTGQFLPLFWQPDLFYIAGTGSQPGFTVYTNISFLRHSSFADVRVNGKSFRAWNVDHLDCDGNPTNAPPYSVKIETTPDGLKAVPIDFETLSNYEWCVDGQMVAVGQTFRLDLPPGRYTVEVEAIYNDIKASTEVEITLKDTPMHRPSMPRINPKPKR